VAVAMRASLPLCVSEKSSRLPWRATCSNTAARRNDSSSIVAHDGRPEVGELEARDRIRMARDLCTRSKPWETWASPQRKRGDLVPTERCRRSQFPNPAPLARAKEPTAPAAVPRHKCSRNSSAGSAQTGEGIDRNRRINPPQGIPAPLGEPLRETPGL
jgi:hypothetical protein